MCPTMQVAQHTHLLHTIHKPSTPSSANLPATQPAGAPLLTTLLANPLGEGEGGMVVVSGVGGAGTAVMGRGMQGRILLQDGSLGYSGSGFSAGGPLSILVPSQSNQVPHPQAVIFSSSAGGSSVVFASVGAVGGAQNLLNPGVVLPDALQSYSIASAPGSVASSTTFTV